MKRISVLRIATLIFSVLCSDFHGKHSVSIDPFIQRFIDEGSIVTDKPYITNLIAPVEAFEGRKPDKAILKEKLVKFLQKDHSVIHIWGLGGIGKTQLIRSLAKDLEANFSNIFLCQAGHETQLLESFQDLAKRLNLQIDNHDPFETIQNIVNQKLQKLCSEKSNLLIIDDLDPDLWPKLKFPSKKVHVILISREHGSIKSDFDYKVSGLEPEAAIGLIQKILKLKNESVAQLAKALKYYPLAINQASRYIHETGMTIDEYLQVYRTDFQTTPGNPDLDYAYTLKTVWELTLSKLREKFPETWECLQVLIHFSAMHNTPIQWMDPVFEKGTNKEQTADAQKKRFEAQGILKNFAILEQMDNHFSLHSLVHQQIKATVASLSSKKREELYEKALICLERQMQPIQEINPKAYLSSRELVAQFELLKSELFKLLPVKQRLELNDLASKCLRIVKGRVNIEEYIRYQKEALLIRQECPETPRLELARNLNNIGWGYDELCDAESALQYLEQSLAIRQELLNTASLEFAESLDSVASILRDTAKYQDAFDKCQAALEIRQRLLRQDDPLMMESLNNIGMLLTDMAKYKEAEHILWQVLNLERHSVGDNHSGTATCWNNLARCLYRKGEYVTALQYFEKAHDIYLELYGKEHPYVATSLDNAGTTLIRLNRTTEALEKLKEGYELRKITRGEENLETALSLNHLSLCYTHMSRLDEALEMVNLAHKIYSKFGMKEFKGLSNCFTNMGSILQTQGKYEKALEQFNRAYELRKKYFGERYPLVADSLSDIGKCLYQLGKYEDALKYFYHGCKILLNLFEQECPIHENFLTDFLLCIENNPNVEMSTLMIKDLIEICKGQFGPHSHLAHRLSKALP